MRPRITWAGLASLIALTIGCNGAPPRPRPPADGGLEPPEPDVEQVEQRTTDEEDEGTARLARVAAARVLPTLLPIDPREVQWFELRRGERVTEAALFTAEGPEGRPFLESAGLCEPGAAHGDIGLRLWRTNEELWVFPGGALGPELGRAPYRAWAPESSWSDDGESRGRRGAAEVVETRAGSWRCVRTEHLRAGDLQVRHFFAPDRGLVRLEVVERQVVRLRLDLVEVAPRGRPSEGYDASSPQALWRSIRGAVRRADVEGFDRLIEPSLRRRSHRGRAEHVDDPLADHVRAQLNEVIALDLHLKSAWSVNGDQALATGLMAVEREDGEPPATTRCQVVLVRDADGTWRWNGVRSGR